MHGPWHMPEHPDEGDYSAEEREREEGELIAMLEAHAEPCPMGVGCDEVGVCYAAAVGEPYRCPREHPYSDEDGRTVNSLLARGLFHSEGGNMWILDEAAAALAERAA